MSENRVNDPFEGPKKRSNPKKAAKRVIYSTISRLHNRKMFVKRGISFQLAALLPVVFLLILLQVSILTQTVSASGAPTAAFTASPISGCSPRTTTFTETSTGNGYTITKWEWDFNGDGAIDRTDTTKPSAFTYTYTTPGIYTVTLKVTTSYGTNTKTRTSYITAQGSIAAFTATPISGCSPLIVTFTNAAQGIGKTITKWEWDFNGDGTVDHTDTTAPSPVAYTYNTPGTYTAKLTTTTLCGTNTMTKAGYITAYGPPTADFTATPTTGCYPLTVAFTDTSNGNGGTITGWAWDFGDSTTYNGQTPPAHLYSSPGTYTVKLTATTSCGTNTMTKTGYITAQGSTADFTATPTSGCSPLSVTFTNAASGLSITKWEWDFNGDGTIDRTDTSAPSPFAYTYNIPGTYTVTLTTTTSCGTNTMTKTNYITAQGSKADFTATPTTGCSPLQVTFTNAAQAIAVTITKWQWDFNGDGTVDRTDTTTPSPFVYSYNTPGTYTVTLTTTTSCGTNTMTKTNYITAQGSKADFTATPTTGCSPLQVTFTNAAQAIAVTITKWQWDFNGDGTVDRTDTTSPSPFAYTYNTPGTYTVKLTTTTSCGTNTKTNYITVSSQPVVVPGTYGPACVSGSSITLVGSPGGGTWFGDGVSGNIFNPALAGPGNHVLTYQYTSGSSCSSSNSTTLTVVPLPQTTITVG